MTLPGRVMMSRQECLRKTRKPLMGKGKKANKQIIGKDGNPVWTTVKELDPFKCDKYIIETIDANGEAKQLTVLIPKGKPASKSMGINKEAYKYFISDEMPEGFRAPKNFEPKVSPHKISINLQAWKVMSETERLEWHLNNICLSQGGTLKSYSINDA